MARIKVPTKISLSMALLHQENGVPIKDVVRKYQKYKYSKSSFYRHCKQNLTNVIDDKRKHNKGRPSILSTRDERKLVRELYKLWKTEVPFTAKRLQVVAGLEHCSVHTIRRTLHKFGFKYLQTRRKGRMSTEDLNNRIKFAKSIRREYSRDLWTDDICFYLDGKSFIYKSNPKDQARAPRAKEWRKTGEGLKPDCVAKGSKVGSGGKVAHFMVAISYKVGVLICEQYHKMNGAYFADFVCRNFKSMFENSVNPKSNLFIQDGDPSQNSKVARLQILKIGGQQISIPPRSPDLNPIENFFNLIEQKLREDAIAENICHETFEQFSNRVRTTIMEYPSVKIDKIVESMDRRITLLLKNKGERLKY